MTDDPAERLVAALLEERRAREAKLEAIVGEIMGRPAVPAVPEPLPPPPPTPALPPPPVPEPVPAPLSSLSTVSEDDLRERFMAVRSERDELLKKNLSLFEELQKLQETPPPVRTDGAAEQVQVLEALVVELRKALGEERAALEAERRKSETLEARVEGLSRKVRAHEEERASGIRTAQDARAMALEAAAARAAADLAAREQALAAERQARVQAQAALQVAEVRVRAMEEALRSREVPEPAVPTASSPAPVPPDAGRQIQASRQAWLDAILKELAKR